MQPFKSSRQRDLILKIVRSAKTHPTADWIYIKARERIANISLGTVYRNLSHLVNEGKIQELNFEKGIKRYDGDLRDHYHVSCLDCGKIVDVPHISARTESEEVEKLTGFQIIHHHLVFCGFCPDCLKKRESGNNIS